VRETFLPRVEIDSGNTLPCFEEGNCDMQCCGGLSRAALLVTEHDYVRRLTGFLNWLNQHATPLVGNSQNIRVL
jgi:hypothetical protein